MRRSLLKLSLIGAVLAVGAFADDIKANKGKADATFVEEAYVAAQSEIRLSQLAVRQSSDPAVKQFAQQLIDDHTKANDALRGVAEGKGFTLPTNISTTTGTTGSMGSMGSSMDEGTMTGERMGAGDNHMGSGSTNPSGGITAPSDTYGARENDPNRGSTTGSLGTGSVGGTGSTAGGTEVTATRPTYTALTATQRTAVKKYDDLAKKTGADFDKNFMSAVIDSHKKSIRLFEKESKTGNDPEFKGWATSTLPTLRHHLEMAQTIEKDLKGRRTSSM